MGRRKDSATFGGFWAFPGGVVEDIDHDPALTGIYAEDAAWRSAALRETAEEVGVFVTEPELSAPPLGARGRDLLEAVVAAGARFAGDRLVYLSNWVTPEGVPRRFDTRFFAVDVASEDVEPVSELEETLWIGPSRALDAHEAGTLPLMVPTIAQLEMVAPYHRAADFVASVDPSTPVTPVLPRMLITDDGFRVLLPGDEGYE